jgi:hypothetical protein
MIPLIRMCYGGSHVVLCESRFGYTDSLSFFFEFNACFSHLPGEAYARYNGKIAHGFVIRPPEIIHVVQSLKAIFSDSTEASLLVNIIWCHCDST